MTYTTSHKSGFTLVEILVAISILSMAILATFTAVSQSLRATNFSEDQIIAYHLADEALEYIRNKRDSNAIQHIIALGNGDTYGWLTGISDRCILTACSIDVPNITIAACTGNAATCPVLRYNATNGSYQYTTGTATLYTRSVAVTMINATEASVSVTVSWTAQNISKNYTQTVVLKNWTE
jgi:type II secretion system protein I